MRSPGLFFLLAAAAAVRLDVSFAASSHSLRYFYTAVSEPGQGLPQFIIVGYVDDQPIEHYDSNTRKDLPRVPWMKKVDADDPQYWERNTQISRNAEQVFRGNLATAQKYYNQSGGLHTVQWMYGCELRSDGSKGGYLQYGYDGSDYLSFDKETRTWTAADSGAQNTKRKWEAEPAIAEGDKAYLEEECVEWLQRYLGYGKETQQQRTEQPTLRVTRGAAHDDGMETLLCRADGFYPKELEIAWTRDGEVWSQDTFRGFVAPNADGTYHMWVSAKIAPQERDRYRCRVGHDSLPDRVEVAWEEPKASVTNLGLIVGGVVGGLVLLAAAVIGGIYLYRKRQDGYKAASTSDRSSDSSARVAGSNPAI